MRRGRLWLYKAAALAAAAFLAPAAEAQSAPATGCDAAVAPGDSDPQPRGVHLLAQNARYMDATFCVVTNGNYSWLNAIVTLFSTSDEVVGSNSWGTRDTRPNSGESNPALVMPFSVTDDVGPTYTDPTKLRGTVTIELQWCTTGINYPDCPGAGYRTFRLPFVSDGSPAMCPLSQHPYRRRRHTRH